MKHFRKIWDAEKNAFLMSQKGMNRREAFAKFCERYPDAGVTLTAFYNQRSRIGASDKVCRSRHNRKPRPLYSEQTKKGYVRIKIAQPSVWVSKAKWVYMETHPWEDFAERSNYIFLDGDNRNFARDNIARVELKYMGIYNRLGGTIPGEPEANRVRIALAKLKYAEFSAKEKTGRAVRIKRGRVDIEKRNARARRYYANLTEEKKEAMREERRKYFERLKADPVAYARYKDKRRIYQNGRNARRRALRRTKEE